MINQLPTPRSYALEGGLLVKRHGPTRIKQETFGLGGRKVMREIWRHGLDKHRDDGPALIERDLETGIITNEIWFRQGQTHRAGDLPAQIQRDPFTGTIIAEEWWENNKGHRIGAPNCVGVDPVSGIVVNEYWGQNGVFHREDGPAEIHRHARTGILVFERWWAHGQFHRDNGPAEIDRHPETGEITYQQYWVRGVSPDGPAIRACSGPQEMAADIAETLKKLILRRAAQLRPQ